ncbi:ureidoglycolate lyase [Mesorhizobium sp. ES1-4]|uniref:ureidoglycolate lyase n=1 Tax=Mesorhizobium sp. ES1-4 TaxID=2876627 RepID=UPI001CC93E0D|nr:ureidoglycolate lyase [Mesorhizobium sp. ES1-4]MBZ9799872.1 ureidoglycolate lyase [Mesorhizobium sp. ES1-4]
MPAISVEPVTTQGFAPFGQLLPLRSPTEARLDLFEELANLRKGAKPRMSLMSIPPTSLPIAAVQMERHVFSSQTFIPQQCEAYLVLVAPHASDGRPDMAGAKAFHVPGNVGINYCANTWHHPITVLGRPARFLVLTFVDGTPEDEQFVSLSEPVAIEP